MLYKIAKQSKKKKKEFSPAAFAGGLGAGLVAPNIGTIALLSHNNHSKWGGEITPERILEHLPDRSGRPNLEIERHEGPKFINGFAPKNSSLRAGERLATDTVFLARDVDEGIMAHELAHSTSKQVAHPLGVIAYKIGQKGSMAGAAYGAYKGARGEKLDTKETILSMLPSLAYLPEETRANMLGARAMYKLKGWQGVLKSLPQFAGSQLSYLGVALSPIIVNRIAKFIHDRKQKNKE